MKSKRAASKSAAKKRALREDFIDFLRNYFERCQIVSKTFDESAKQFAKLARESRHDNADYDSIFERYKKAKRELEGIEKWFPHFVFTQKLETDALAAHKAIERIDKKAKHGRIPSPGSEIIKFITGERHDPARGQKKFEDFLAHNPAEAVKFSNLKAGELVEPVLVGLQDQFRVWEDAKKKKRDANKMSYVRAKKEQKALGEAARRE